MNMNSMALSYKGGKESDIILHQFLYLDPFVFHINISNEFPEIIEHIKYIEKLYNIVILKFNILDDAIDYIKQKHCYTIVMGNKKTDIGWANKQTSIKMGPKHPMITSYNPLYEWSYKEVWNYITREEIPVCKLYEYGYTSISTSLNTFPNYFLF